MDVREINKGKVPEKKIEKHILRLKSALHGAKHFCSLCLSTHAEMWPLESNLLIAELSGCYIYPLRYTMDIVFGPTIVKYLMSGYLCKPCKESVVSAYTFISNSKNNIRVFEEYVSQLYSKASDVYEQCVSGNSSIGNVLFVLDEPYDIMQEERKKNRRRRRRGKKTREEVVYFTNENDPKPYKCNMCDGEYASEKHLREHKYRQHKVRITKSNYDCSVCFSKYHDMKTLRNHLSSHDPNEKHSCLVCALTFDTRKEYLTHSRNSLHRANVATCTNRKSRILHCSVCKEKFTNLNGLKIHLSSHAFDAVHYCTFCSLTLESTEEYLKHINTVVHKKKEDPNWMSEHSVQCDSCDYMTFDRRRLLRHTMHKHLNMSPFVCTICSQKFISAASLKIHIKRHNASYKPEKKIVKIQCDHCSKTLGSRAAIKKHMRIHTGEKPYPCDLCELSFRCASDRNNHKLRKHTGKTIRCPLCEGTFNTTNILRTHVKRVHWKRDEKFDYTKLEGLTESDYELFRDRRTLNVVSVKSG